MSRQKRKRVTCPESQDRDAQLRGDLMRQILDGLDAAVAGVEKLAQMWAANRLRSGAVRAKPSSGQLRRRVTIARLTALIEARIGEPLDVGEIARTAGCSREHLSRLFKQETGTPLREFVREVRLSRVRSLILDGTKVEAAALLVGYRSTGHFYRDFSRRFGMPPGRYRARNVAATRKVSGSS